MLISTSFTQRRRENRLGIAAAEFALVLPILCMMLIAMFELSRGMMAKQALNNAARKGCRTGILHAYGNNDLSPPSPAPPQDGSIYHDVVSVMRDYGYDSSKFDPPPIVSGATAQSGESMIIVTVKDRNGTTVNNNEARDANAGSIVTVQVIIPVSSVMWVSSFFLKATSLESETVVMMKQ